MTVFEVARHVLSAGWFQVLLVFLLPWGPGAVAGILLARKYALSAGMTIALYVLSDIITAIILEPLVQQLRTRGERSKIGRTILQSVGRVGSFTQVTSGRFGLPLGLFIFTFATDFFTAAIVSTGLAIQRVIAWIAIIVGDVVWFLILFLATIGIASFLSDDRIIFIATMVLGFALPPLMRRLIERRRAPAGDPR